MDTERNETEIWKNSLSNQIDNQCNSKEYTKQLKY